VAVAVNTVAVTLLLAVPELLVKGIQAVLKLTTPAVAAAVAQVAQALAVQGKAVPAALGYLALSRGRLLGAAAVAAVLAPALLLVLAAAQVVVDQVLQVVVLLILAAAVAAPKMLHPQEVAVLAL
jgi:hypothetical protein